MRTKPWDAVNGSGLLFEGYVAMLVRMTCSRRRAEASCVGMRCSRIKKETRISSIKSIVRVVA